MTYTDVMIDLETLGLRPDCPIVSIGAVQFNIDTGEVNNKAYYRRVEWINDQLDRPLSRDTVKWWLEQDPAAQAELTNREGAVKLKLALKQLEDFIPKGARIWANGATFDPIILDDAYQNQGGRVPPWGFRNVRDCRTIKDAAETTGWDSRQFNMGGQFHNALDDCIFQIKWTCSAWQRVTQPDREK